MKQYMGKAMQPDGNRRKVASHKGTSPKGRSGRKFGKTRRVHIKRWS